nr:MAG TPA: hypothetical protein [Herelleviridae sp.]
MIIYSCKVKEADKTTSKKTYKKIKKGVDTLQNTWYYKDVR